MIRDMNYEAIRVRVISSLLDGGNPHDVAMTLNLDVYRFSPNTGGPSGAGVLLPGWCVRFLPEDISGSALVYDLAETRESAIKRALVERKFPPEPVLVRTYRQVLYSAHEEVQCSASEMLIHDVSGLGYAIARRAVRVLRKIVDVQRFTVDPVLYTGET